MISLKDAGRIIGAGGVVAYPTETAYGLGASAFDADAVEKVYRLKGRQRKKKIPVIVSDVGDLEGHAFVNELGHYLSRHLHPGPLNIVVNSELPWLGAFRISSSPIASELAKLSGPITATSANKAGGKTPFSPKDVKMHLDVPIVGKKVLATGSVSTVYDPFTFSLLRRGAMPETTIKRYVVAFNVLKGVKPSESEVKKTVALGGEVLRLVKKKHRKSLLGGSVAKGTFTKSVNDIDIFLLFPKEDCLKEKIEFLKKVAGSFSKRVEVSYAQHPYVKARYKGVSVELVPAYETKPPEILSAADRSRWHVKFVSGLPENVKDEVRVLKRFCKGIGVYGAEARIEGFSAYAMEVLVSRAGSFVKALEKLAEMKWPIRLSDPVDENRNVLASVSRGSFELLKEAAKEFLKSPGENFFFPVKPRPLKKLPKIRNKSLLVLKKPKMVEDAVWGNAKKRARKIERNARLDGYLVKRWSVFVSRDVFVLFELFPGDSELLVKGPPRGKKQHVKKFKSAHPAWFVEGGRLYTRKKRRFPSFSKLVRNFEEAEVFTGSAIEGTYKKMRKKEKEWVTLFFVNKKPWEY
ncbi:hypothetical protein E2P64_00265 [Candidatus Bathyarchaeota archaeon]|nr:hypothetical protein E2P64_00265 [Candidatus Bathyarchaeota archaeon]